MSNLTRLGIHAGFWLALAFISALAALPATWVLDQNTQRLPFHPVATRGTIWHGQTLVAIGQPGYERTLPDPVRWQTSLTPLPEVTVTHPWLAGPVIITLGLQGLHISAQTIELPAPLLTTVNAVLASANPGGEIQIKWPAQSFGPGQRLAGTSVAQIEWQDASVGLTSVAPLGSYRADVSTQQDGTMAVILTTIHGPLVARGSGSFSAEQRLLMNLTLEADPAAPAAIRDDLQTFMSTFGAGASGQGQTRLRLQ